MALLRRKLAVWFVRGMDLGVSREWVTGDGAEIPGVQVSMRETSRTTQAARYGATGFWRGLATALRDLGDARAGVVRWPGHDQR